MSTWITSGSLILDRVHFRVMPVEYVAYTLVHMASLPLDCNILNQVRQTECYPHSNTITNVHERRPSWREICLS